MTTYNISPHQLKHYLHTSNVINIYIVLTLAYTICVCDTSSGSQTEKAQRRVHFKVVNTDTDIENC